MPLNSGPIYINIQKSRKNIIRLIVCNNIMSAM